MGEGTDGRGAESRMAAPGRAGRHKNVIDAAGSLQAAHDHHAAVVKLTRELVRIPSRGGIDGRPGVDTDSHRTAALHQDERALVAVLA